MSDSLSVVILDDEAPARERLQRLIEALPGYHLVASLADGLEAVRQIEVLKPDLALLDIAMPGVSGIDVARHISRFNDAPAIVFCTAFDEYAVQAFEAGAVGYLLKPIRLEKLEQALASASRLNKLQLQNLPSIPKEVVPDEKEEDKLRVKSHRGVELIAYSGISCFLADGKYVTVKHSDGETLLEESLSALEVQLADRFIRCHRSALVRIEAIQGLDRLADGSHFLSLAGLTTAVPVSRRHIATIREILLGRD